MIKLISMPILILTLFLFQCKKENTTPNENELRIVFATGGLNMRSNPEESSEKILLIPDKEEVKYLSEIGEADIELNGKSGKWTKIKFNEKEGYVFGGYLNKAKLHEKQLSPKKDFSYSFYSYYFPGMSYDNDCVANYMNTGCLVVIKEEKTNKIITFFESAVISKWIDNEHLENHSSLGDAGAEYSGTNSIDVKKNQVSIIWSHNKQYNLDDPNVENQGPDLDVFCLKKECFDLKNKTDYDNVIKSNPKIKFYNKGEYKENLIDYNLEVFINDQFKYTYIPDKNILIRL